MLKRPRPRPLGGRPSWVLSSVTSCTDFSVYRQTQEGPFFTCRVSQPCGGPAGWLPRQLGLAGAGRGTPAVQAGNKWASSVPEALGRRKQAQQWGLLRRPYAGVTHPVGRVCVEGQYRFLETGLYLIFLLTCSLLQIFQQQQCRVGEGCPQRLGALGR